MKTKLLSIIALVILTATTSISAFAASDNNRDRGTIVAEAANFNKIEVRGNVELYLTTGAANSVKAYNNYYGESALVQNQDGTLRVSSYAKEKLVVFVTAADLRAINVYDNSAVKTFKNLSAIELDVNLYNNASAQLNIDAFQVNFNVADRATANLAGNINACGMNLNQSSTVNSIDLKTDVLTKTVIKQKEAKNTPELAVI